MDNKHNSLNLAAKICSDICPWTLFCSSKLTVFLELRSRKTVRFSGKVMCADKYPTTFSRQMKAIVYISNAPSWNNSLRAATCKYQLQLCKIEKSKILKLCHNKGFRSLITEILVSVHSRKYFSFAATFPSRTLQGQANHLKIPLLYAHSLEIIKY